MRKQSPCDTGILGGNEIRFRQDADGTHGDILQIADGGAGDV